jgi:hypothetical protein
LHIEIRKIEALALADGTINYEISGNKPMEQAQPIYEPQGTIISDERRIIAAYGRRANPGVSVESSGAWR